MVGITTIHLRTALIGIGAALWLVGANAVAIEEPGYEVVKSYPRFELRRSSGRWTQANYLENEDLLLAAIEKAGLTPVAPRPSTRATTHPSRSGSCAATR